MLCKDFLSLRQAGAALSLLYTGFSLCWLPLLQSTGSRAHGLSSCGAWASLPLDTWDLPRPAFTPVCPALVGGFLTTRPPGNPITGTVLIDFSIWSETRVFFILFFLTSFLPCMSRRWYLINSVHRPGHINCTTTTKTKTVFCFFYLTLTLHKIRDLRYQSKSLVELLL